VKNRGAADVGGHGPRVRVPAGNRAWCSGACRAAASSRPAPRHKQTEHGSHRQLAEGTAVQQRHEESSAQGKHRVPGVWLPAAL